MLAMSFCYIIMEFSLEIIFWEWDFSWISISKLNNEINFLLGGNQLQLLSKAIIVHSIILCHRSVLFCHKGIITEKLAKAVFSCICSNCWRKFTHLLLQFLISLYCYVYIRPFSSYAAPCIGHKFSAA